MFRVSRSSSTLSMFETRNSKLETVSLPLQQIHFIHVDRLPITEEGDQNSQPDGSFSCCVGDYKNCENLTMQCVPAVNPLPVARKRHQVQIDGVQDQLNRHQYDHDVPPREHANHTQQKQSRT